jgi:hypothetical protein
MEENEIFNEKRKNLAVWFNQVATAILTAGCFVPSFQAIFNILPQTTDSGLVYGFGVICIVLAIALHWLGRTLLGGLR